MSSSSDEEDLAGNFNQMEQYYAGNGPISITGAFDEEEETEEDDYNIYEIRKR